VRAVAREAPEVLYTGDLDTPGARGGAAAGGATPRLREVIEKLKRSKRIRKLIAELEDPWTEYERAAELARRLEEKLGIPVYLEYDTGWLRFSYCSEREPVVLVINIEPPTDANWWLEVCEGRLKMTIIGAEEIRQGEPRW